MDRATTYTELKNRITRIFPDLSNQLQRIARFALDKPDDMALGTVASVAEATAVQPSAMIRFANALGYGGFSEMQQVFRSHLVERSSSYRERIDQMRRQGTNGATGAANSRLAADAVLHRVVGAAIGELGHLEEHVSPAQFRSAVRLLGNASHIHVLAQKRAYPIACYLAYALSQLELRSHLVSGAGGTLDSSLASIAPDDVLVVASFRPYAPEVVAASTACHARGVKVLAITDGPLSPLAPVAALTFDLGDDSSQPFRSLVAPFCLAQALVVSIGHHLADKPAQGAVKKRKRGT